MLFSNPLALLCQKAGLDGLAEFPRSRGDTGSVLKKNDEKKKKEAIRLQNSSVLQASSVWWGERSFIAQEKILYPSQPWNRIQV